MKFLDLGLSDPSLRPALDAAYRRVMDSGWVVLGPEVEAFEREFAAYCGAAHAVGVPTSHVKIASSAATSLTARVTNCGWMIVPFSSSAASLSRSRRAA